MTKLTRQLSVTRRKNLVSQLRLRGQSIDAITYALSSGSTRVINPSTNKPYDRATIARDIKAMVEVNIEEAEANAREHKARQFAEIQEVKRSAWSSNSLSSILRALELEMKLLGTNAPIQIQVTLVHELVQAIEKQGKDPNPVLRAMIDHLNAKKVDP